MKIIIIGAGVAGLSAGIYAQKAGFDTVIYEKNEVAGGNCSGWYRSGYTIDNCLHWLTGTQKGTGQYQLWDELGIWKGSPKIVKREAFYTSEYNGQQATLWRDVKRAKHELLALSPEDEQEILAFFDCVNLVHEAISGGAQIKDIIRAFFTTEMELSHPKILWDVVRYGKMNLQQYAACYKHPLLQKLILDFSVKEQEAYWLIMSYSFFAYQNGDIIEGGSIELVRRLVQQYKDAGGKLFLKQPVRRILIEEKADKKAYATGVLLADDTRVKGDYVIGACDIHYVYHKLLQDRYTPKMLLDFYRRKKNFTVYSSFQVAYAVEGLMEEIDDTVAFDCRPITVGTQQYSRMKVKNYRNYGDYIAPMGHTVIQCSFVQYESDFKYWKALYQTPKQYQEKKQRLAEQILQRMIERYGAYEGKIKLLDVWTPYSYAKRTHNYRGAYMRFFSTAFSRYGYLSRKVKGVEHLLLANHWLTYPGGVPTAAYTGKQAIMEIQKNQ